MPRGNVLVAAAFAAIGVIAAAPARADEPRPEPRTELRHDLRIDIPATAALGAVTVGVRLVRDDLEPSACRVCDPAGASGPNAVDRFFRDALVRRDTQPANVTSYALAFGAAPASALALGALAAAHDGRGPSDFLVDFLVMAEGGFSAMLVAESLESVILRERPYVHAMTDEDERRAVIAKTGAFHSLPSGHVAAAFGAAAAAGTVASMRGYRLAPIVWASGIVLGVATAYTRMAADRHYFTDTLAGAGIGVVVGAGIPLLAHRPRSDDGARSALELHLVASPGSVGVAGAF